MINYYRVLNVSENASDLQIKQAYRKFAIKYHPDKTKNKNTEEFIKIKNAYDILICLETRKKHDQELSYFRKTQEFSRKQNVANHEKPQNRKKTSNKRVNTLIYILLIIALIYSYEFLKVTKNSINDEYINSSQKGLKYDSLKIEDSIIEERLKKAEQILPKSGELKF